MNTDGTTLSSASSASSASSNRCAVPEDALIGLAGDFVRDASPMTEADPLGLLVTQLAGFGAMVGAGPYLLTDSPQPPRFFPVLVGDTAKARKGTGLKVVRRVLLAAEPGFDDRIMHGFGSGESFIDAVANPDDDATDWDGRLWWVEEEFAARILKVCNRDGNTLSANLRSAFDGARMETRSRGNGRTIATGHHVVILGHAVEDELRRYLATSEIAGGFANRFAFFRVRRARRLPRGGYMPDEMVEDYGQRFAAAIVKAQHLERVDWSGDAAPLWDSLYDQMADDEPRGLLGSIVARPEANVARLALVYALLAGSPTIERDHLIAAWSIWQRGRHDAESLFGEMSGDPDLDRLLERLNHAPAGFASRELDAMFGGHSKGKRVGQQAVALGLAEWHEEPSGGRPRRVIRRADKDDKADKAHPTRTSP